MPPQSVSGFQVMLKDVSAEYQGTVKNVKAQKQADPKTLDMAWPYIVLFFPLNVVVALGEITSLGCTPKHLQVSV